MISNNEFVDANVTPNGHMDALSKAEVSQLLDSSQGGLYELYRNCSLAVLNCGHEIDDANQMMELNKNFDIKVIQNERGIKLALTNAPSSAFVDGEIIKGISELLFAVLRDVVFIGDEIMANSNINYLNGENTTDTLFHILRNANVFSTSKTPNIVVCWGGHSISRNEYDYTKEVGYQLGLRGFDICTGCGAGAMKGPMKGATIAHAKQRIKSGKYLGLTEPGIIAAEAPNPIVNELVILPDIEKRLEAFVRISHSIIVFPGGVGTTEEILYLLGILLEPGNEDIPLPVIFTGPDSSKEYFQQIDDFIEQTLGPKAQSRYEIIIDNPDKVAQAIKNGIEQVCLFRERIEDAYYFNWSLNINDEFQTPFIPTHENMEKLQITSDLPPHALAADLRRAFSGIVAGNVKLSGIQAIKKYGNYKINGDAKIMDLMDRLLAAFVEQKRMKLASQAYRPCYDLVNN